MNYYCSSTGPITLDIFRLLWKTNRSTSNSWTGDLIFIFRFCFCTRSRCLYTPPPLYSGNEVCPIVLLPLALEPPFFSFHFVKMMMFLIPLIKLLQYKGNFNSIRWQA